MIHEPKRMCPLDSVAVFKRYRDDYDGERSKSLDQQISWALPVNHVESDKEYGIVCQLPDVSKESVEIFMNGRVLTITVVKTIP